MKNIIAAIILAGSVAFAATVTEPTRTAENHSRACFLPAGGWTVIDCSAAAAYSAALTANSRYLFQSTGDDTYITTAAADSGADADANDLDLDDGKVIDLVIHSNAKYVTCLGTANSGKIKYIECQ